MGERVAIVGSRDWPDADAVRRLVDELPADAVVVSGGARGVDRMAEQAARRRGLAVVVYRANWDRYGKQAGFLRNRDIIADCDRLVAFHLAGSRGTQHSIDLARKAGKPVDVRAA